MISYPWLKSTGDKFVEHGHRLAGMAIGLMSIAFVAAALWKEPRRWVRGIAVAVLLAVIVQGLLGGQRVLADAKQLAMLHGSLAAVVFALMGSAVLVTSRSWLQPPVDSNAADVSWLKPIAFATPVAIYSQFLLGGILTHLGRALYEHAALAVFVLLFVVATTVSAHLSRIGWLRRSGHLLCGIAATQIILGIGSWITKYGFASLGYVAVQHSALQVVVKTSHTVVGMLLFMTSVVFALRVLRVESHLRQSRPSPTHGAQLAHGAEFASPLAAERGAG
jgi:cytochrome c oxidase assembly protein subunit 15